MFTELTEDNLEQLLSTNQKAKTENDASVGRQLIYTAMYTGSAGLQLKFKDFENVRP